MQEINLIFTVLLSSLILLFFSSFVIYLSYRFKQKIIRNTIEIEKIKNAAEKRILETQLEIQELTFSKISSEIHDNISLGLTLAKLQINSVIEKSEKSTDKLVLAVDLISKSLVDLNDISKSMDGSQLLEYGLINAIESEVKVLSQTGLYDVEFDILGEPVFLDQKIELVILRIMQEACNNVIKHARANNIRVELYYEATQIKLKIVDNGIGFDPLKVQEKKQIRKMAGLKNIYTRAEIVGGKVEIFSTLERGTTVLIHIPLNPNSNEKRRN